MGAGAKIHANNEEIEAMRPVCVYTAGDRIEAEMLLEALQRNRIQGFREARGGGDVMDVYTGNSIFGEKIYVDELDAPRAAEIIESVTAEADLETAPEDTIPDPANGRPGWFRTVLAGGLILLTAGILFSVISSLF